MTLTRRSFLGLAAALPLAGVLPQRARAGTPPVYAEGGVAVDGTDVVAYFTQDRPVPGDPAITHDWNGATWRFATEANRDAFAAEPARYAPQYGGYCAYAVSEGYTAATDPDAWSIVDGKLYLNYSRRIRRRWERDIPGRIANGDANWPKVLN
ncbi:twin-arginine translocation signal domain-containing protein [Sulfitobacter albidus]|uniref:Twin-arginine translocation signal domain-containing protein n=1 Tax=Sulfitobacter albidus TaxID=2829501 RepID=A0A975PLI5_9RHOB|nr:YHS domain-containing (seleno)protein [Sulfitobacter albidus]QUJ75396.1 twin-arginine translocation signal domain-containing protein [Sulfitobacter albidus]